MNSDLWAIARGKINNLKFKLYDERIFEMDITTTCPLSIHQYL